MKLLSQPFCNGIFLIEGALIVYFFSPPNFNYLWQYDLNVFCILIFELLCFLIKFSSIKKSWRIFGLKGKLILFNKIRKKLITKS